MAPEVRSLMDRYEKNGAVEVVAGRLREARIAVRRSLSASLSARAVNACGSGPGD